MAKYVWYENSSATPAATLAGFVNRWVDLGFVPIVTTSSKADEAPYINGVYSVLPASTIGGFKFQDMSSMDDYAAFDELAEACSMFIELRRQAVPFGTTVPVQTIYLEAETFFIDYYWSASDRALVNAQLYEAMKRLPPARYVFYPALVVSSAAYIVKAGDLIRTLTAALTFPTVGATTIQRVAGQNPVVTPGVSFVDAQDGFADGSAWGTTAASVRQTLIRAAGGDTIPLVYTNDYSGGWTPAQCVAVVNRLVAAGRSPVLYQSNDGSSTTLAYFESVS